MITIMVRGSTHEEIKNWQTINKYTRIINSLFR